MIIFNILHYPNREKLDLHIDHIKPISSFDHTNEDEIHACWNWKNLQYLPAQDNFVKSNKRNEKYELKTQILANEFFIKYYNTISETNNLLNNKTTTRFDS